MNEITIAAAQKIDGWMFDDELIWLAKQAARAEFIIEVGCYKGRTSRCLADNTDGTVLCIDPWDSEVRHDDGTYAFHVGEKEYEEFNNNLSDHLDTCKIIVKRQKFTDFHLPSWVKADFIFIDGDHRKDHVKADIEYAMRLISPNGILAGHDYKNRYWPFVKPVVDDIFRERVKTINTIWWVDYAEKTQAEETSAE